MANSYLAGIPKLTILALSIKEDVDEILSAVL